MSTITREPVTPVAPVVPAAPADPKPEPEAVVLLREARALVERAWIQGWCTANVNGVTGYCAVGATNEACGTTMSPAYIAAIGLLLAEVPGILRVPERMRNSLRISRFNDDPSTTRDDVLALFDRAIQAGLKGAK